MFVRYVDFESHNTRSLYELRHGHIPPAEFWLYDKYKKINFAAISENRTSGNWDKFNQNDLAIDTREVIKSCKNLLKPSQELFYNSFGIDQDYRSPLIHHISRGTCKDSVNISSTTNCVSEGKNQLSVHSNIKHQVKDQINLVDRELEVLQRPNVFSVEPSIDYSNRCFPDRVASSPQRGSNIMAMVRGGENLAHKCAGTASNRIGSFTRGKRVAAIHFQIDNKAALYYLLKMRSVRQRTNIRSI